VSRTRRSPAPVEDLVSLIERSRIAICCGAGGVGKTTLAAAIAVRAARDGRRVACLTIDPARRLADSLGVAATDLNAGLIDITEQLRGPIRPPGRLSFGMLDPVETFNAFVRERSSSPEKAERILDNKLYRYVSGSLSGMQEYMALEKLCEIRNDPEVELVVLDTPPTANAIDFFTAPGRMVEALDGTLVRVMRRAYGGPGKFGLDLVGRWASAVLKTIGRVTGAELLGEMMSFVDALSDLFGSFSERAAAVEQVLRGGAVCFCLITTPDGATLRETREFRQRLAQLGLAVDAVVFNRAHWPSAEDPPPSLPAEVTREIERVNRRWNVAHEREADLIRRVREGWDGLSSVSVVPLLPGGATRVDSLELIGGYL
jgi:anion-transporting  ArsA/GET3 family ATPase